MTKPICLYLVSYLVLLVLPHPAMATVRLPQWFGDGMVLQTSEENGPAAYLAGITEPAGEKVNIHGDAGEYSVTSEADSGHWKVTLDASTLWKNTKNMTITVAGATGPRVVATGVQAGDVYWCAGQSNMLFSLHQALNYTAEAATLASYPNFRFFMTNRALNASAQWDLTTDNANCDAAAPAPAPLPPSPTPPGSCSASGFLNDTAFGKGHGPSIGKAPAKDAADCCAQCSGAKWAAQGCSFFTFEPVAAGGGTAGTCWFKTNSHGPPLARAGYVSGGRPITPPPAAAKPCNKWVTPKEAAADANTFLLSFSAVCYMTVRNIARQHTRDRPMGLIQAAWGGSRLESWMSAEALASAGAPVAGNIPANNNKSPKGAANTKSALYNGMVSPWTNFSVRAALWYQGEENADQSCQVNSSMWPAPPAAHTQPLEYYAVAYEAMVHDWRQKKGYSFPLGTMQLPPSVKSGVDPAISNPMWAGRPDIRGAEASSGAHPAGNTTDVSGVAVTIDLGGASNWGDDHPPNKNEMSRRLSLQLLHTVYGLGQESIPLWTGPVLQGVAKGPVKGAGGGTNLTNEITLTFTSMSSAGGLSLRDVQAPFSVDDGRGGVASPTNNCTRCCEGGGAPFEITTDLDAPSARINGRNVTWVRLPRTDITVGPGPTVVLKVGVHEVTGLRYAWTDFVDCVLDNGNSSGIPAGPFRHWF
jgi:hypothetical protein